MCLSRDISLCTSPVYLIFLTLDVTSDTSNRQIPEDVTRTSQEVWPSSPLQPFNNEASVSVLSFISRQVTHSDAATRGYESIYKDTRTAQILLRDLTFHTKQSQNFFFLHGLQAKSLPYEGLNHPVSQPPINPTGGWGFIC